MGCIAGPCLSIPFVALSEADFWLAFPLLFSFSLLAPEHQPQSSLSIHLLAVVIELNMNPSSGNNHGTHPPVSLSCC